MLGETAFERHEHASARLEELQAEIRALIARLNVESIDEEEPYSLPSHSELHRLLDERAHIMDELLATEEEILKRLGLPGDPELIGSRDVASGEQVGGAEDPI